MKGTESKRLKEARYTWFYSEGILIATIHNQQVDDLTPYIFARDQAYRVFLKEYERHYKEKPLK